MIMFLKDRQYDGLFYCSFMSVFVLKNDMVDDIMGLYLERSSNIL